MIGESARKSGLLTSIFLWELSKVVQEKTTPPLIATKTYNPIVYKAMNALHRLIAGSILSSHQRLESGSRTGCPG